MLTTDKPYHLLFIPHHYLMGILCEENETNTWETVYPFKLQGLFFFFYCPPMSSWIALKLLCTLVNSIVQLTAATTNISLLLTLIFHSRCASPESELSLKKTGSGSGSVWPSALLVGKVTARICLSKRSVVYTTMLKIGPEQQRNDETL